VLVTQNRLKNIEYVDEICWGFGFFYFGVVAASLTMIFRVGEGRVWTVYELVFSSNSVACNFIQSYPPVC